MSGRILIVTSNHPDKLDAAVTRPGRIDLNLEFSLARHKEIEDIFKLIYKYPIDDLLLNGAPVPLQDHWSHASVMNIFLSNIDRPMQALRTLSLPQVTRPAAVTPSPVPVSPTVHADSFLPTGTRGGVVRQQSGSSRSSARHTSTESDDSYSNSDCNSDCTCEPTCP